MAVTKVVSCPRCGVQVEWAPEHRYRPFCSERCKLADLGRWLSGEYRVPGPDIPPDEEDVE